MVKFMDNINKKHKYLFYGVAALAFAATFVVTTDVATADSVIVPTSVSASGNRGTSLLGLGLDESKIQMSEGGSATYGRWEYKYTAQPYAFFYNSARDQWKMVQVTSYAQHTINVMIDGYYKTFDRYLKGQYL